MRYECEVCGDATLSETQQCTECGVYYCPHCGDIFDSMCICDECYRSLEGDDDE